MVVDDIPENLQVLGNILNKEGYNTSFAQDGITALEIINETKPDLVLLDISMPDIDGFEVCSRLKEKEKTRDIPIIFLSARTQLDDVIQGFSIGAADYITKPFNPKELLARVQTHLQLKQKTDEIIELNSILKQNNQNITDSIIYAKRIQSAMLPPIKILSKKIPDYFIMYKPKDIVSGDFFWFEEINDFLYIVSADCTGHGVPGAFMSILSMSLLYQIVEEAKITNHILPPNEILNKLRVRIINTLNKDNETPEIADGLDISLVLIDLKNKKLQFSGANQSLLIASNDNSNDYSDKIINSEEKAPYLKIIPANRMPIGIHSSETVDFSNYEVNLQNDDKIYLWSDGYLSQFGGDNNRKFGTKQLRELILQINNEPMPIQKQILEKRLFEWKKDESQTDDILVIGLKMVY